MARVIYVVARNQPLLRGYLTATVGARAPDGDRMEIKLDERRGERRQQSEPGHPERRRGERRLQPSLDSKLRSQGYPRVVQFEITQSQFGQHTMETAIGWQPGSTWRTRRIRGWRRRVGRVSAILRAMWRRIRHAIGAERRPS